ncbi:MAG: magnesium transporter CorA family protein [Verrucomicrobia bacterium]|nr:magnesium transporter CorA family protein [Verrucomicrobiota bacterium]
MIEYYFKTAKEENFLSLPAPKEGCWIHIDEATSGDLDEICQLTGLEITDVQDSLDRFEVPRIEKIHNHVLIFTRHPVEHDVAVGLYTTTFTMILTTHYFITISPQKNHLIRSFVSKKGKFSTLQRSKLMINLLLRITQEFTSHIRRVRHNVLDQEKEMANVESDDIAVLTRNEEILNQYLSTLEPTRGVLEGITSGRYTNLYEKDQEQLEDLLNAVKQSETLCSIAVKTIRSLRDSYNILFTNNLHKTIKLLTSLTIIFNIPTMIASIYGMNIDLPLMKHAHAFALILSMITICSAVALIIFRRKKWL